MSHVPSDTDCSSTLININTDNSVSDQVIKCPLIHPWCDCTCAWALPVTPKTQLPGPNLKSRVFYTCIWTGFSAADWYWKFISYFSANIIYHMIHLFETCSVAHSLCEYQLSRPLHGSELRFSTCYLNWEGRIINFAYVIKDSIWEMPTRCRIMGLSTIPLCGWYLFPSIMT